MKEKKEKVSNTEKEVKERQDLIAALRHAGKEMYDELVSLKRQIGGYKTSKTKMEKKIAELQAQVEHYKELDKEGDELNEKRIAEIDFLKSQNEKREKELQSAKVEIKSLKEVNTTLSRQLAQMENSLDEALVQRDDYRTNYETIMSLPWYKRIFLFL